MSKVDLEGIATRLHHLTMGRVAPEKVESEVKSIESLVAPFFVVDYCGAYMLKPSTTHYSRAARLRGEAASRETVEA